MISSIGFSVSPQSMAGGALLMMAVHVSTNNSNLRVVFPPGHSSPSLDPARKSPTLDQVVQSTTSATGAASTAPAPGPGRRSPTHGRTAPSTAAAQSSQKAQHQDSVDTRRGEI